MVKPRANGNFPIGTEVSPGLMRLIELHCATDGVGTAVILRRALMHLYGVDADGKPRTRK